MSFSGAATAGNFSLFQSIPDSWAIKQLFPVMPIHRLGEKPAIPAVLGDITCDSDGKIDQFIDRRDVKKALPLHTFNGDPYYLGVFLVGAYQEILGDLHNLFGDTHAVHVSLDEQGNVVLDEVVGRYYTAKKPNDYVVLDDHFGTEEYGVGTRKDDTALLAKLQKAMDEMKADGSAARISTEWFGKNIIK